MLITEREVACGVILDLAGPLVAGAPQFAFLRAVGEAVRAGHRRVIVNLNGVPSIDAAGIGALAEGIRTTRLFGARLLLADVAPRVRHLLALTGLLTALDVVDSVSGAPLHNARI